MKAAEFKDLIGDVIVSIDDAKVGSEEITITTESSAVFRMYHEQSCCEHVQLEEIIGDLEDVIGYPILMAEEASNDVNTESADECDGTGTWTFYKLATAKGYVTLRWLGESNGYYSESVSFERVS